MIVSKTPHRISFFGGGTDLPSFYNRKGYGAVLSASINAYVYVSVKSHGEVFDEKIRLNYYDSEEVDSVDDIKNTIIKECLNLVGIHERIYIGTVADVQASTGLGSSSSFAVGLLHALYRHKGINVTKGQLAEEASHIEIDVLKSPIGKQDQYAASFGGMNYFRFNSDGTVTIEPVILRTTELKKFFDSMLVFWTGITRSANSILQEQNNNNSKSSNLDSLERMRDQATQMKLQMESGDFNLKYFGNMMNEAWEMKRSLASKVSNKTIDLAYGNSLKEGAYGGKISGAGGGGFLNIFANKKDHKKIIRSLEKKGMLLCNFGLDTEGTKTYEI